MKLIMNLFLVKSKFIHQILNIFFIEDSLNHKIIIDILYMKP